MLKISLSCASVKNNNISFHQVFKTSVRGCLEECAKRNLSSIAFPAIGIGTHSFPISVTAKLMINEATQFLAQKPCSLTAIYLAAYSDVEFATFQNELRHLKSASSQASTVSDFSMWGKERKDNNVFRIGRQIVEVIRGDITDEQTDVIVSSTDRDMKLHGTGVAAAISKKAGPKLQRFCDQYTSHGAFLEAGIVISTPACGELKCKAIFHTNFQWDCLEKSVLNCLNKAAQEGYVSISFPALGTGNHNFPSEKTASVMTESINMFYNASLHLELIRIVLFQEDMYKSFLKTFQSSELCTQSIAATKATDVKKLNPIHNEQAEAIGSAEATSFDMDTCYFIVYGESSNVESAALELNKVTSAPSLSSVGSSEYHLKVSETEQGRWFCRSVHARVFLPMIGEFLLHCMISVVIILMQIHPEEIQYTVAYHFIDFLFGLSLVYFAIDILPQKNITWMDVECISNCCFVRSVESIWNVLYENGSCGFYKF